MPNNVVCNHPARPPQARNMCKACYDKWLKKENPGYRERQLANAAAWIKRNPDRMAAAKTERERRWNLDPEAYRHRRRAQMLWKKYKITPADYDSMLHKQSGGCALCYRAPAKIPLHVDHDHKTGKVRGLLCHQCNWYLGKVDKDLTLLSRIAKYVAGD